MLLFSFNRQGNWGSQTQIALWYVLCLLVNPVLEILVNLGRKRATDSPFPHCLSCGLWCPETNHRVSGVKQTEGQIMEHKSIPTATAPTKPPNKHAWRHPYPSSAYRLIIVDPVEEPGQLLSLRTINTICAKGCISWCLLEILGQEMIMGANLWQSYLVYEQKSQDQGQTQVPWQRRSMIKM